MKKSYLLFIAAGLCCLAACNKEMENNETPESPESVKMITETINANLGADTKVTIADDGAFAWTAGENIAVHVSNGDIHKYVLTSDDGASGASASASSASFTVVYPEGYSRDAFAVYPSTIVATTATNYGQSGSALDVTLPNEYTLEQVSSTTSPCPMIASNTGSGWEFYHLCGLLRLTVNSIPPTANKITVNFHGNKVHGAFSVASPVTAGMSSIVTATGSANDEITITFAAAGGDVWRDGVDINLPLPTGDYTNITVKAFAGASELLSVTRPVKVGAASYTINKAAGKKCTASLPAFSVSPTKRVAISRSNLQCTTTDGWTTWTWSFMDYPWSVVETSNLTADDYADATAIGLFCWGTSGHLFDAEDHYGTNYKPFFTTGSKSDYGPDRTETENSGLIGEKYKYGDWGVEAGSLEGYSNWRTPTGDEYLYLFALKGYNLNGYSSGTTFDNDAALAKSDNEPVANDYRYSRRLNNFGLGMVNGKKGMIVLPDYFVDPSGKFVVRYTKDNEGDYFKNLYTEGEWTTMAQAGAVFLPIAGTRSGKTVNSPDGYGRYWSVTPHPTADEVWQLTFHYKSLRVVSEVRNSGRSVRLIRDLN